VPTPICALTNEDALVFIGSTREKELYIKRHVTEDENREIYISPFDAIIDFYLKLASIV
jgi:hypothetical protein